MSSTGRDYVSIFILCIDTWPVVQVARQQPDAHSGKASCTHQQMAAANQIAWKSVTGTAGK